MITNHTMHHVIDFISCNINFIKIVFVLNIAGGWPWHDAYGWFYKQYVWRSKTIKNWKWQKYQNNQLLQHRKYYYTRRHQKIWKWLLRNPTLKVIRKFPEKFAQPRQMYHHHKRNNYVASSVFSHALATTLIIPTSRCSN